MTGSKVPFDISVGISELFRSVFLTTNTSCAISINNKAYCCGKNDKGQIRDNFRLDSD